MHTQSPFGSALLRPKGCSTSLFTSILQYKHTCFCCSCGAAPTSSTDCGGASTPPVAPAPPLDSDAAAIPATELSGSAAGYFFGLSAVFGFFFVGFCFFFCFFFSLAPAAAPSARLRFFPLSRTQSWCWLSASQKKKLLPMHHFHVPLTLRGRLQRNVQLFLPCWPPPCPFRHGMQLCDTIGEGTSGVRRRVARPLGIRGVHIIGRY